MRHTFTDAFIKSLKQPGRYTDPSTKGLNIQVKKANGKYWTYRYLANGKRRDVSLGSYPDVGLKEARIRSIEIKAMVNRGETPLLSWRSKQAHHLDETTCTGVNFRTFAAGCVEAKRSEWRNPKHAAQWTSTIEMYANPIIGDMPIDAIELDDVLKILTPIWNSKTVTASRLRGRLEWVFAAAITRKLRNGQNPAAWKGLLETILPKPNKIKNELHHVALSYKELHIFVKKLHDMDGIAALALEFLILNASRTNEVIGALRSEIKPDGTWVIPGSRMKAGKEHRVPLSQRSLDIIQIAKARDTDSDYLFSIAGKKLSNMAMSMLLRRMGYAVTVHGFRSTFRDWIAEETDHSPEVAEKALAHSIANKVESAYRRGDLFEARRRLMADWTSYCQTGLWGNVFEISNRRAA